jgi:hypothetical protein
MLSASFRSNKKPTIGYGVDVFGCDALGVMAL